MAHASGRATWRSPPRRFTYARVCELAFSHTNRYVNTHDPHRDIPAVASRRNHAPTRRRETREALIDAAAALFGRDGLDAPSLDDICAKAGFTRGAFYVHFKSREELIVAVVERHSARALDAIVGDGGDRRRGIGAPLQSRWWRRAAIRAAAPSSCTTSSTPAPARACSASASVVHLDATRARLTAATLAAQADQHPPQRRPRRRRRAASS